LTIITLTTDFGWRDNFVGVMKGVILGLNPRVTLVDLSHELPPHDPAQAAFSLYAAYHFFPEGTIHLAVVDPGVGSDRSIIIVKAFAHLFIAPDNGLLSYIIDQAPIFKAYRLENPALALGRVSRTFQARDLMAPAAAHLSLGFPLEKVGPETANPVRLPPLHPETHENKVIGRVVYVDRFGNLITNIPADLAADRPAAQMVIRIGAETINGLSSAYASARPGELLAVAGGSGFVEIARNRARAERPPDLTLGTPVVILFVD